MSKEDAQFNLRMPSLLRRKVTAAAKENGRSVTAEINSRLESSFSDDQPVGAVAAREIIERATVLLRYFEQNETKA